MANFKNSNMYNSRTRICIIFPEEFVSNNEIWFATCFSIQKDTKTHEQVYIQNFKAKWPTSKNEQSKNQGHECASFCPKNSFLAMRNGVEGVSQLKNRKDP